MTMTEIFSSNSNIAVVGMSRDMTKAAFTVPGYMIKHGYTVIPVNPLATVILKQKSYPTISNVPERIDILNVFRPSQDCFAIVEEAVKRHREKGDIKVIWLQLGIINNDAKMLAEESGITFIQDSCIYVEHKAYKATL